MPLVLLINPKTTVTLQLWPQKAAWHSCCNLCCFAGHAHHTNKQTACIGDKAPSPDNAGANPTKLMAAM